MSQPAGSSALAARLKVALESRDQDLLARLLAADVRWGGAEDTPDTCHSRADVLQWYGDLAARGVRARVEEVLPRRDAVIMGLRITRPGPAPAGDRTDTRYQVYRVRDGLIVDIRGYPDLADALSNTAADPQ